MVKRVLSSKPAWLVIVLCLALLFCSLPLWNQGTAQTDHGVGWSSPYVVGRPDDGSGRDLVKVIVPGTPPKTKAAVTAVPEVHIAGALNSLTSVPGFNWSYGCSATSAAMLFGYYDLHGYSNMYTGPTGGGVCPLTNAVWGPGIGGSNGECPLSATHLGKDSRAIRGTVDDYWIYVGDFTPDPYMTNGWPEHTPGECTGDFMGTSQYKYGVPDGSTMFVFDGDGDPLYDYTGGEPSDRDGCHGTRLFAQSRSYAVLTNFSQLIRGVGSDPNKGFTFANFQSEIDAGRPVLIHVEGHTMLGYGYNTDGSIVYLHDTWDYSNHQMTWGGSYSGLPQFGVSVIRLQAPPTPTVTGVTPSSGCVGESLNDVLVTGTNFTGATAVSFGSGVTVASFVVSSSTQITADISVASDAFLGPRIVSVTTPAGTGNLPGGFTVVGLTQVYVAPVSQTVIAGETFTVNIAVAPGQPIAGVRFDLAFDPLLLVANSVAEGNLLNQGGASTFFDPGTINNVTGTIDNCYGAIVSPPGASVSLPGVFATITFTAKPVQGTSPLDLSDVVVGNPLGQPVCRATVDGQVTVEAAPVPTVTDVNPGQAPAGSTLNNVVITGTAFTGATAVSFGSGIAVEGFTVDSTTLITARIKMDVCAGGLRDVSVTTPFGTGTLPEGFNIIAMPVPPVITALDPGRGCQGQGLDVHILHTCLPGDILSIDFGAGIVVEGFSTDTTTRTTAAVAIQPDAAVGERDVSIITTGGTVSYPTGHFTVWPAGELTEVYILPVSLTVDPGEVFTVDVVVEPGVAIAGVQFRLCFDPSLIAADSVAEGNLLKQGGANTTFSPGTIDNVAGCISSVYGAITTPGGSVSSPGVFATVTFTGRTPETQGVSALDLSNVIVGNPAAHPVPVAVSDGSVTVKPCPDWDVNCDGCVNVLDIILVGQHFGETGSPRWIREDVNGDGVISVLDIILIGQHFGEGCHTEYKVGAVFAVTGYNSTHGMAQMQTVQMLVEQINGVGGVNGHPLDVTIYDTGSDVFKCALLTERLVNEDGVAAVIGPSSTGESLAVIGLMNDAQVPLVSCGAGKQIVEPVEERYWVFKTAPSDSMAVQEVVEHLTALGIDKAALLTDTSALGINGRNELLVQLPTAGIAIAADEVFSGCDVAAQLASIASTDAQAVICWASVQGTACVAQAMDGLGMTIPLIGSHAIASKAFIEAAGEAANGVVFPSGKLLIAGQLPDGDPQKAVLLKYRQDFESLHGVGTANGFGGHAYDALMGVVGAMKAVGPDRAAIRDFLENSIDGWAGVTGVFDTSPSDHNGLSQGCMVMVQIVDGQWDWLE